MFPKSRSVGSPRVGMDSYYRDEADTLDTYHPPIEVMENSDPSGSSAIIKEKASQRGDIATQSRRAKWFSKFSNRKTNSKMYSLDSTSSSSSVKLEQGEILGSNTQSSVAPPIISITSNEDSGIAGPEGLPTGRDCSVYMSYQEQTIRDSARRENLHRNQRDSDREYEYDNYDDDDDELGYGLSLGINSSSRNDEDKDEEENRNGLRFTSREAAINYHELLDDRQGMNDSEHQFTKGEASSRASIDGSIISELNRSCSRGTGGVRARETVSGSRKLKGGIGSGRGRGNRRNQSPSLSSVARRSRHTRGFFGLARRLKLTKRHDSIAALQLSILNSGLVALKTLDKDLQSFLPKGRLSPKEFSERVRLMRRYKVLGTIEYRFASRYETYVCRHANQEINQPKNQSKRCIPYDYNRVVLRTLPNSPGSDYINASHIDSCLKPNAYIATQGPNEETVNDFWRMVWEQKSFVIVMLTKVFDFIRVMCHQYWPVELNKPERYGGYEVTLLHEEPLADFVIRTIKLTKLRQQQLQPPSSAGPAPTLEITQSQPANIDNSDNSKQQANDEREDSDSDTNNQVDEFDDWVEDDEDVEELVQVTGSQLHLAPPATTSRIGWPFPPVRTPKFVCTSRRSRQRRKSSFTSNSHRVPRSPPSPSKSTGTRDSRQERTMEFLFPDRSPSMGQLSQGPKNPYLIPTTPDSINSALSNSQSGWYSPGPATPLSPTPSSAGIDRSSATRKAVKKKRRARPFKNLRPTRTQFQVPDEAALIDDDEDEDDQEGNGLDVNDLGDSNIDQSRKQQGQTASSGAANERIVYQFHFHSWSSHVTPFIGPLLHFRRRVRICMDEMSKSGKTGPTIVHCNDGCGRTGAYLCVDANLELSEEDNVYDVYYYTRKMRQSRKFLIDNLDQYKFVYDTIDEAMYCDKTWFPISELSKRLQHKSKRNPLTKKNEYQREYEKITRMSSKFSIGDCAGGHRVENREKNRDVSTVPPDNFRPYLTSFQSNDHTDYINAVFVDGYTRSKEYIVTEWPSHKTISDFWSLIYDHDCNSVILLANPTECTKYPSFLPSEKELRRKFGPVFSAEMVSYTHYQNIKSWIYTINKKIVSLTEVIAGVKSETKTTQVFQITCWPQGHRVPTSTNALVELMNMVERWRQRTAYGPVCVVSLDGKARAGVYCAANVAIEQVVQHSEVDVFQAVKTVRRHRPQLIENMTEYKYCYDLILHYVLNYVNHLSSKN